MRDETRVKIRVYASKTNIPPYRSTSTNTESTVVEMRDGEILADAIDRGAVTIMERLEVNHVYNVRSEPVTVTDVAIDDERGR